MNVLCYYYYTGLVFTGMKNFGQAQESFQLVSSSSSSSLNCIFTLLGFDNNLTTQRWSGREYKIAIQKKTKRVLLFLEILYSIYIF